MPLAKEEELRFGGNKIKPINRALCPTEFLMESYNQNIIRHKSGLLNLAAELGNISKPCRIMGVSRDTFYRYQTAQDTGGIEALFEVSRRKPNLKNRVEEITEEAVVQFAQSIRHMARHEPARSCARGAFLFLLPMSVPSGCVMVFRISSNVCMGWRKNPQKMAPS